MNDSGYLIFTAKGLKRLVKGGAGGRRKRPALASGEYAVLITVNVSAKFFAERPTPSAVLNIPEQKILEPEVIVAVPV